MSELDFVQNLIDPPNCIQIEDYIKERYKDLTDDEYDIYINIFSWGYYNFRTPIGEEENYLDIFNLGKLARRNNEIIFRS